MAIFSIINTQIKLILTSNDSFVISQIISELKILTSSEGFNINLHSLLSPGLNLPVCGVILTAQDVAGKIQRKFKSNELEMFFTTMI
jgi:hypothetical protein